jgi:hypothetical protein
MIAFGSHSVLQPSHNVYLIGNEFTFSTVELRQL